MTLRNCACATYNDGSVYAGLCSTHSTIDPCLRITHVTGKRRKGSIKNGTCSNCGWSE